MAAKRSVREVAAYVCAAILVVAACAVIWYRFTHHTAVEEPLAVPAVPYNDVRKAAIDLYVEQIKTVFQITLIALGLLIGLVAAKKDEARIVLGDRPEILMFIVAFSLLMLSLYMYYNQLGVLSSVLHSGADVYVSQSHSVIPDIMNPKLIYAGVFQFYFLIAGLFATALTLVSAHWLKE